MTLELQTLQQLEPAQAEAALGTAALLLGPQPEARQELTAQDDAITHAKALLSELRGQFGVIEGDTSNETRERLSDALLSLLDSQISGDAIEAAASRLGEAGLLSPAAYKVIQADSRKDAWKLAPWRLVLQAVTKPDDVQHLEVPAGERSAFDATSLFLRFFPQQSNRVAAAWLLVQSLRNGMEQKPTQAWWVFPDEVDLTKAQRPIDVLQAFAERYGFELKIGNDHNRFFRSAESSDGKGLQVLGVEKGHEVIASSVSKFEAPRIHFTLAYAVDMVRYRASVIRHGRP
jgi:hypothetical protein